VNHTLGLNKYGNLGKKELELRNPPISLKREILKTKLGLSSSKYKGSKEWE